MGKKYIIWYLHIGGLYAKFDFGSKMFLRLNHKNLDVYKAARELLKLSYRITKKLPPAEKFNLIHQINRAALSVKLNIAEGSSRKSPVERKRFYQISRSSVIEIDAAAEAIIDLEYLREDDLRELGLFLNKTFSMLTNMIS
jgi:four helix bundle protein